MELGTDKIEKIFDAADVLAETGGAIYSDKKINLEDLPAAISGLAQANKFMEAIAAFSGAVDQAGDLDSTELLLIAQRMIQVGNKYEEARKAA